MPELEFRELSRNFGGTPAVDRLSATVREGEFFVVLGPSGCGKSTLLRLVAGLEVASAGELRWGGETWSGPGVHLRPEARRVGVVFQSYALWPHMTVEGNVAFPAETAGMRERDWRPMVARHLETVGLSELAHRRPAELSGGQRQRVALARVLASKAQLVLMDEPLANLDPHLRAAMEAEFVAFHCLSQATTLYITHDQREAMGIADRIAVMNAGRFLQVAEPETLYWRPSCAEVAGFIGRGAALPGRVLGRHAGRVRVALPGAGLEVDAEDNAAAGERPALFVRPEQVAFDPDGAPAEVVRAMYRGGVYEVSLALGGMRLEAVSQTRMRPGEHAGVRLTGGWPLPAEAALNPTESSPPEDAAAAG